MKIGVCMIIAYFPPIVGGTETQTLSLARALITQNVNPSVITERVRGLKRFERIDGVPVYRLRTLGSGTFASLSFMLSSFHFLMKNRRKYQIIHAHLASSPAITATIAGKLLRKKIVVKFGGAGKTGDIQTSHRTFLGRIKLKFLMKYVNIFICPSEEIKEELINYGFAKGKVVKISNGVDIALFHPVNDLQKENLKRRFNFPSLPILVYAGRLERGKGLAMLLMAWQRVVKVGKQSYLVVLGGGSEKDSLTDLAKQLQIIESVKFTGAVRDVNKYLQTGDCFVLPSSAEGLPNALLEAMATGLPVIATKIGGVEEVIENKKNGFLFEPGSVDQLAKGILTLLSQSDLAHKLGQQARRTIEENYAIDIISEKYLKLYAEIIK